MSKHHSEQPLALARRRLHDAIHALADPQPVWVGGVCRWTDPLYTRLRDALQPRNQAGPRRVPDSRAPCNTAALTLIIEIDMTVAEWQPSGDGALDRLHRLRDVSFRPEDCELIDSHRRQIAKWILTGVELLGDKPPEVALRLPCPSCGRSHVHRTNSVGERVRSWALRVSDEGARCQHCEATWQPSQFTFLATLLGLPGLPA